MSVGPLQIIVLLVIVLLIFGPSRLKGVGTSLGEAIRGFKKGVTGDDEIDVTDSSKREQINQAGDSNAQTSAQQQKTEEKDKV